MLLSMTGFGKAECKLKNKNITIEVKSLNSKQIDIFTRVPGVYKEKDIEIRKRISEKLVRGKVEFNLFSENMGTESNSKINSPIVEDYFRQYSELCEKINMPINETAMPVIMRLPDTVKVQLEELDENEWKQIAESIDEALDNLIDFRNQEGKALATDIENNINAILTLMPQVEPFEGARIEKIRERINENMKEFETNGNLDKNRFEQEMIFYLEKLDINEEKVRLKNHCDYFLETMKAPKAIGKKLGFITQEIGREINTMGSKANETNIQKIVIQMKDHLERIKEQVLNVL